MPKINRAVLGYNGSYPPLEGLRHSTSEEVSVDYRRSYECYGVVLQQGPGDQLIGECPFCGKEGKFYVNKSTGCANCFSCWPGGNLLLFMRRLWDNLDRNSYDYSELASSRGVLSANTFRKWGVVKGLNDKWLVPGYNAEGSLVQLYRYTKMVGKPKARLYPTPNPTPNDDRQGLHMMRGVELKRSRIIICEGFWDGAVLSEVVDNSYDIVAVPGCNIFKPSWLPLLSGKEVILLFHNDHPGRNGRVAGLVGAKRVVAMSARGRPPRSISYLKWGNSDEYWSSALKAGYDVRDHLMQANNLPARKRLWLALANKVCEAPSAWKEEGAADKALIPLKCESFADLRRSWEKAMHWPAPGETLDYALSLMIATVTSPATQGEQIYLRVIGPPSSGKTILCGAILTAKSYTKLSSNFKGLYSGYSTGGDNPSDMSLISQLKGKTLIIKDGDTLLQNPNMNVIMAQLRDAFDGNCSSHYGNGQGRDYDGYRFSLIIAGPKTLSQLDRSELGERMIDCISMEGMSDEMEDRIGMIVAQRTVLEAAVLVDGTAYSRMTPQMAEAWQKTAGFINYLRENASYLLGRVVVRGNELRAIADWGQFVSFMRSKEPLAKHDQTEVEAEKELAFRLIAQYTKLAMCLTPVLGKTYLDAEIMRLIRKSCLDTSRGVTLKITEYLYERGIAEYHRIANVIDREAAKTAKLLGFLRRLGIVDRLVSPANTASRWQLTPRVKRLYEKIKREYTTK